MEKKKNKKGEAVTSYHDDRSTRPGYAVTDSSSENRYSSKKPPHHVLISKKTYDFETKRKGSKNGYKTTGGKYFKLTPQVKSFDATKHERGF